ncbi:histidine kinase N-terminal 7TM domain-containing protein [Natrarchaeobius oligotrophus]|uniref:histidine kinase N-terminal 7TM domain-containing protein n=1 Tax=Natrarchaeobius oligotrophus TaxID=3455743 RepID=UPI000F51F86B|nr:histidine kinase N-terminal 7TM domain-containing protein [Natrarchaeobius chitinivorans]
MTSEFATVHAVSLVLIGLLNLSLAALVLRTRTKADVLPLSAFLGGITLWTIPQGILLVETNPTVGLALSVVINSGAVIMATGLFHFALAYTRRTDWLRPGRLGLVYLCTCAWLAIIWTDPLHNWMHQPMEYTRMLLPVVEYQNVGYWLYVFWNWSLSAGGIFLFFLEYVDARGSGVYHRQARLVVLAPLIPGTANVLAFSGVTEINYSVWGFGATGILIAVALYRYRWLDLVPIARDTVVDEMRDGYVVVDDERRIVDRNPAARSLLEDEQAVGKPIGDVLPECVALFEGTTRELTFDRNGAIVDASVSAVGDERTDGAVLMLRDVTDQRRAEMRFQALIENVSDVVTVVDEGGIVSYASPSIEGVLGYRPDELVDGSLFELVHADDRSDATDEFADLCDEPHAEARFEYRLRHRDGSWVVLEGVAVDLLDNDVVGGVVINSRDVTERNARERELERTNRRLEEFAGVISHDLRTPLGIARRYVRFAESSGDREDFQAIRDAHERMDRMITNLLTMARAGTTLTEPSPVEIESVAADAWDVTRTENAALECDLADGWTVVGDREQLIHAFENLFRNSVEHGPTDDRSRIRAGNAAARATPRGSRDTPGDACRRDGPAVTVRIGHLEEDPDGGFVVEDDGVGIPPEQRDLVFERGHTTSPDGTGFGLAIVRDVIEAHDWQIEIVDGVDGGARFEIRTA